MIGQDPASSLACGLNRQLVSDQRDQYADARVRKRQNGKGSARITFVGAARLLSNERSAAETPQNRAELGRSRERTSVDQYHTRPPKMGGRGCCRLKFWCRAVGSQYSPLEVRSIPAAKRGIGRRIQLCVSPETELVRSGHKLPIVRDWSIDRMPQEERAVGVPAAIIPSKVDEQT